MDAYYYHIEQTPHRLLTLLIPSDFEHALDALTDYMYACMQAQEGVFEGICGGSQQPQAAIESEALIAACSERLQ